MTELEKRHAAVPALTEWDYAPAPEARDIVKLDKRYGLFIGGKFVKPKSAEWFPSISPSTEEKLAEVAQANEQDVESRRQGGARCLRATAGRSSRPPSARSTSTGSPA